jgi:hypothetical protein
MGRAEAALWSPTADGGRIAFATECRADGGLAATGAAVGGPFRCGMAAATCRAR